MTGDIIKIIGGFAIIAGGLLALRFIGDGLKILKNVIAIIIAILLFGYIAILLIFK